MNKISTKLATSFIVAVLVMESFLMFYLHQNIVHARIDEEFDRLMASGSLHRDVLEEHYSAITILHIALMESEGEKEIIITDDNGITLASSARKNEEMNKYLVQIKAENSIEDRIIEDDLKNSSYIVSVHPYKVKTGESGNLVMFQSTEPIEQLIKKQKAYMLLSGISSLLILCIVYAILARFLTRPLIRMKEATERLSHGDYNVKLPSMSNDELGELSKSIQRLASDLDRVKKERNEFLASVSHELSTPLTYLIGYSKVAKRSELNYEERQQYLTIIEEESNRMKELVKNLLDLAKIDELNFSVEKKSFFIQPFLNDIYKLISPSFNSKNMRLTLNCPTNFEVYQDPIRLEQIIINLLDNALKYSEDGTDVRIEAFQETDKIVIVVTDEGIGIPTEEQEKIFEKLYRVEKSRSRTYGGTGLGLAIVKELVYLHGGTISVKSKPGKGSTFTVKI